jgi:hypothetical protein
MHNYTPFVIGGNEKNRQLTLLTLSPAAGGPIGHTLI